jgi:Acyltransferase
VLGIYPEGTRSRDGKLHKGKTGVARLALESRAPVVPCAMIGTFEFLPSGSFRPSLRIRPGVIFGGPLDFSRYYGQEADRAVLRAVTDEIMQAIQKLSGQEYVDTYARKSDAGADSQGSDAAPGHDEDGEPGDGIEGAPELLRRPPLPFTRYLAFSPGPLRGWPRPLGLGLCEWES